MKVLIIHSCHLHRDFYNSICAMVGVYSLTGSVSSSSGLVPLQLLSHKLLISPWCHELKFPGSWNVVPQYHDGAPSYGDNRIERLQMVSSLVHSSLVVHCSYRLKFMKDSFLSICRLLISVGLIMFNHHDNRLSHHSQPCHEINSTTIDISL